MSDEPKKCPVCGETDLYPARFCPARQMGEAKPGEPCSYSKEGHERNAWWLKQSIAAGENANNPI